MTAELPAELPAGLPAGLQAGLPAGLRRGWVATIQVLLDDSSIADLDDALVADGTAAALRVKEVLDDLRDSGRLADWKYVRIGSHTLYATPAFVAETDDGRLAW